jgi:hypothetical protein
MAMAFICGAISMAIAVLASRQGKSLSIGVYRRVSLSDARKKRDELRTQLQANLDPSAKRNAANLRKELSAEKLFRSDSTGVVRQTAAHLSSAPR